MAMWRELFSPNSHVYGIDIDPSIPTFIKVTLAFASFILNGTGCSHQNDGDGLNNHQKQGNSFCAAWNEV